MLSVACGHFVGCQAAIFPTINQGRELAGGPAFFVNTFGADQLFEQADLIVHIENGEIGSQAHQFSMTTQDFCPDGMERTEPGHTFHGAAYKRPNAMLHLLGGFVGECDGQQLTGPGFAGGKNVGQAGGEDPCLSSASAGKHENRAVQGFDSFALAVV